MERVLHMESRGDIMLTGAPSPVVTDISQYGGHARDTSVELLDLDESRMEITAPTRWVGTRPPSYPEKSSTGPDQLIDTPLPNPGDSSVSSQWGSPVGDTVTVTAPAPAVSFLSQQACPKQGRKTKATSIQSRRNCPQGKAYRWTPL